MDVNHVFNRSLYGMKLKHMAMTLVKITKKRLAIHTETKD